MKNLSVFIRNSFSFKNCCISLAISCIFFCSFFSYASHIVGGNITYECVGNNKYIVRLNLYRDCDGVTMSNIETVNIASASCGVNLVKQFPLINGPNGTEVSLICPSQQANSKCNGGSVPGYQRYTYVDTVVMVPCTDWIISWKSCCRNSTIVNLANPTNANTYYEAKLNNVAAPCNTSPEFASLPVPAFCSNLPGSYTWSVTDPDGDSLVFSLINAKGDSTVNLPYNAGYTATQPINATTFDPSNATITFNPTTLGNYVVTVLVQQYQNGILAGTIMSDMQFLVTTCTNQNKSPYMSSAGITNMTGNAIQIDTNSVSICAGLNFCFDVVFSDSNATDTILISSDLVSKLSGATLTVTGINPVTAKICWTAPSVLTGQPFSYFTLNASDNNCPIPIAISALFDVMVVTQTYAGSDIAICGTQTAQLGASNGSSFTWSVISGDSINVGSNFSCNPCASPVASPSATTTYEVTSNLSGGCKNKDTVTVSVVPNFTYTKTQSNTSMCLYGNVYFDVIPSPVGSYTYQWTPASVFVNPSVSSVTASFNSPGSNTVYAKITSAAGCSITDSFTLNVLTTPAPQLVITGDSMLCNGGSTQLQVQSISSGQSCGLSITPCVGASSTITIGTAVTTLANTTYPAPYGNWYWGAKHQILYLASELQAMGFSAGKITSLAFDIDSLSGTTFYNGFTLKMGCTTLTSLANYQTGTTTVYGPQNITISKGWNVHTFTAPYEWDGTKNIIVEVCFNNSSYTYNSSTHFTATTFNSIVWTNADNANVCSTTTTTNSSKNRPNTQFTVCSSGSSTGLSYTWSPSTGLSSTTIYNPVATPPSTTTYSVSAVDSSGACADTTSITVKVSPVFTYSKTQSATTVCLNDSVKFTVTPDSTTVTYSYKWSPGSLFNDSTISNPSASFSTSGMKTVYVKIASPYGCTLTDSFTINVAAIAKPDISVSGDSNICTGGSTQLVAQNNPAFSGLIYTWSPSTGLSSSTIYNPVATLSSTTTYTVIAVDSTGTCKDTTTKTINVSPVFTYSKTQSDTTVCLNDSVKFTVIPDSTTVTYSYKWSTGSLFNDSTISNPSAGFSTSGMKTVYVKIASPFGCTITDSFTINVLTLPKPDISVTGDSSLCVGVSAQLTAQSNPPISGLLYTWSPSTGLSSSTVYNPVATLSATTTYTVIAVDSTGTCKDTTTKTINVSPVFTYSKTQSATTVCLNDSVKFTVTPDTSATYSYNWSTGSLFNDSTISSPSAGFSTSGMKTVYVKIASSLGCILTDSFTINVFMVAKPDISVTGDSTVCIGSSSQLLVNNNPPISGLLFSWSPSTGLSNTTVSNPVASPASSTSYTVIASDSSGTCSDTTFFTVSVNSTSTFTISKAQSDSTVCLTGNVYFSVTPDSAGSYTYSWTPGSWCNDSTISNPIATFNSSGLNTIYAWVKSAAGCKMQASFNVNVLSTPKPDMVISGDTTLCSGSSVQLFAYDQSIASACGLSTACTGTTSSISMGTDSAVLSNTTYPAPYGNWYWGAKHQILYRATELKAMGFNAGKINSLAFNIASVSGTSTYNGFTLRMGCVSIDSITTFQSSLVTVYGPQNITITTGWNTYNFSVPYSWDGVANLLVEVCFNNSNFTNNSPTYHTLTSYPSVVWRNADISTVCSDTTIFGSGKQRPNTRFNVCPSAVASGTLIYSWSPTTSLSATNIYNPIASPSSTITYTLIANDSSGTCNDTTSIKINVVPTFTYIKTQSPSSLCSPGSVQFFITPTDTTTGYKYKWTPSLMVNNDSIANPVATLSAPGTYKFYITITHPAGCVKKDSVTVIVGNLSISGFSYVLPACGSSDGSFTVIASGGASPYTYSKDSGVTYQTDTAFNNLPSGTYYVRVKDAGGCTKDTLISLTPLGSPFLNSVFAVNPKCSGELTGKIEIYVSGGTPPYMYSINNGATFQSGSIFNGLGPGVYNIVVKDTFNCSVTAQKTLTQPLPLQGGPAFTTVTTVTTDSLKICAQYSNGTPPYVFKWSNGKTDSCIWVPGASALYTVTVSDQCDTMPAMTIYVTYTNIKENIAAVRLITVSPNPSNGSFVIDVNDVGSVIGMNITNIIGEVVVNINIPAQLKKRNVISLPDKSSGVYFLKVTTTDGVITRKIVVQ